jgi:eight-cysteine-cluster-containing protein
MARRLDLAVIALVISWPVGCERTTGERAPAVPTGAGQVGPGEGESPDVRDPGDGESRASEQRSLPSSRGERVAIVPESHSLHGRLEVPDMPNACDDDEDCHVGGCSSETCSAEADVVTTCEVLPVRFPEGSQCGCVEGQCRWWHPQGAVLIEVGASTQRPEPRSGDAPDDALAMCGGERCKPGQECVSYYGIAGSRGPRLHSCEWRCRPGQPNDGCPGGMRCRTLADGPGHVCR